MITCLVIFLAMSVVFGLVVEGYEDLVLKLEIADYSVEVSMMFVAVCLCAAILMIILIVRVCVFFVKCCYRMRNKSVVKQYETLNRVYALLATGGATRVLETANTLGLTNRGSMALLRGCAHFYLGQYETAESYFSLVSSIKLGDEFGMWLLRVIENEKDKDRKLRGLRILCNVFHAEPCGAVFKLEMLRIEGKWNDLMKHLKLCKRHSTKVLCGVDRIREIALYMLVSEHYENGDFRAGLSLIESAPESLHAALWKAKLYVRCNKSKKAINVLEEYYVRDQHPEIAMLYTTIVHDENVAVDRLVSLRPDCYTSEYLIARKYVNTGQYNAAEKHLRAMLDRYKYITLYYMMLDVMLRIDGIDELKYWVERMQIDSVPDRRWECAKCCTVSHEWKHECGTCSAFDSIRWIE